MIHTAPVPDELRFDQADLEGYEGVEIREALRRPTEQADLEIESLYGEWEHGLARGTTSI